MTSTHFADTFAPLSIKKKKDHLHQHLANPYEKK
jgi:hypothetical protein